MTDSQGSDKSQEDQAHIKTIECTKEKNQFDLSCTGDESRCSTELGAVQSQMKTIPDDATKPTKPSQSSTSSATTLPNSSIPSYVRTSGVQQRLTTPQISIEQQLEKSKRDLESMVIKYATSERENLQNKMKVEDLDKKLKRAFKDNDSLANRIKLLQNDKNQLADTLSAKVAQLTVLEQKNSNLNNFQDAKMKELEEKVGHFERINEELLKQIETYKSKEGELLDFSERLSMKQILLQAELDKALEQRPDSKLLYDQLSSERDEILQQNKEFLAMNSSLTQELDRVNKLNECLRDELNGIDEKYRHKIDVLENEIKVMRRKHQMSTRELMKELRQLQT